MAKKKNLSQPEAVKTAPRDPRQPLFERIGTVFAAVLFAVFPLYLTSDIYVGLTGHKAKFYWLFAILAVSAFLIIKLACIGQPKAAKIKNPSPAYLIADCAALAYAAWLLISMLATPLTEVNFDFMLLGNTNPRSERYDGLLTHFCYIATYFMISRFWKPREGVVKFFAVSAILVSFTALIQWLGADPLYPYALQGMVYPYASQDIIFRTTLGNVDILSAYTCVTIPLFAVLYALADEKRGTRFLYLGAAAGSFMTMIIGEADSGKVGVLAAVVVMIAFFVTDRKKLARLAVVFGSGMLLSLFRPMAVAARAVYNADNSRTPALWINADILKSVWLWGGIALLLIALGLRHLPKWIKARHAIALPSLIVFLAITAAGFAGVAAVGPKIKNPENFVWQASEVMKGNLPDEFGSWRGYLWKRTATLIPEHPVFGTGPDTFMYAFARYQSEAAELTQTTFDKAHNELLQIAVVAGIPAALFYTLLFLAAVWCGISRSREYKSPLVLGAVCAAVAVFAQSLFGVSVPIATPLFFGLLGILTLRREPENV